MDFKQIIEDWVGGFVKFRNFPNNTIDLDIAARVASRIVPRSLSKPLNSTRELCDKCATSDSPRGWFVLHFKEEDVLWRMCSVSLATSWEQIQFCT